MILTPADLARCDEIADGYAIVSKAVYAIAARTGIPVADIMGRRRFANLAAARQLAYFVAHENGATAPVIADAMDRTLDTVWFGINAEKARRAL